MEINFTGKSKVTKQGQATLPNEARKELGIETEQEIFWYRVDGHLVVTTELMSLEQLEALLKKRK